MIDIKKIGEKKFSIESNPEVIIKIRNIIDMVSDLGDYGCNEIELNESDPSILHLQFYKTKEVEGGFVPERKGS